MLGEGLCCALNNKYAIAIWVKHGLIEYLGNGLAKGRG